MVRISGKQHGRLYVSSEVAAVLVGQALLPVRIYCTSIIYTSGQPRVASYFTLRDLVDHSRNFSWASPCYHLSYFSKSLNSR